MPGSFLQGERVSLRPVEEDDLAFIRDGVNHPDVWKSVGGQAVPTNLEIERKFFDDANRDDETIQLLITVDGERAGLVELSPIDWVRGVAEIGYWVHPDHQGQGTATDALDSVVQYAFDELRLRKVTAEVVATNQASQHVVERVGFVEEGVLRSEDYVGGDPIDVVRYGLLVTDS